MHNVRNMSRIKTLRECLLKVKGVKLYWKNDTKLSSSESTDESTDESLYNNLKVWNSASGS